MHQVRHFFNQEVLPKVTQALVISQLLPRALPGDAGETTRKLQVIQNAVGPAATEVSWCVHHCYMSCADCLLASKGKSRCQLWPIKPSAIKGLDT